VVLPSIIDIPTNRAALGAENAHNWVKPESLAQVICFLASEAAQDVRGAAVPVYGMAQSSISITKPMMSLLLIAPFIPTGYLTRYKY
jgi:hypothetical protein